MIEKILAYTKNETILLKKQYRDTLGDEEIIRGAKKDSSKTILTKERNGVTVALVYSNENSLYMMNVLICLFNYFEGQYSNKPIEYSIVAAQKSLDDVILNGIIIDMSFFD